jgi:5-methylthioadenosine/S-adenosylhomocysteine deaminase
MSTDMLAIVNARVVTVDAQGSVIDNATIVVDENGLIREISSGSVAHTATTVIDARGGIVMPGLVNAHAHLGMEWLTAAHAAGNDTLNWLAPHSTYLLGEDHLLRIAALAEKHGAHIHVHASETVGEMKLVANRHNGRTPIQVLADTDLLTEAVLAHGVHLTDEDIELIADHHASVTHCPASNQKLASGTARILDLHKAGVNVALGTDGPASGNDLDLWLAMRLAGYAQKNTSHDPTVLPALDVLRMATINGAKALHVDHLIGSLEVGKAADIIVLDVDSPSLTPVFDPHVAIVAAAGRGDVSSVVVNGRVVVHEKRSLTIDHALAVQRVRELGSQVMAAVEEVERTRRK